MPDAADGPAALRHECAAVALTDASLAALGEEAFAGLASAVLAVSGGADSMCLLLMVERWLASRPAGARLPVHVATVDHRLRPASAAEAAWVADRATVAGFPHHTLAWSDDKPATGVQQAARTTRYALLADLAGRLELPRPVGILVAHQIDDVAETHLMRLARGSGLDGLASMAPSRDLAGTDGIRLIRPFLPLTGAQLRATLVERGLPWLEDPSNADSRFERVRMRRALGQLSHVGIASAAIGRSAMRLRRARTALEHMTDDLADRALRCHGGAFGQIELGAFDASPQELQLRLLQRVLRLFGDRRGPPRMTRLEALTSCLTAGRPATATLAGCRLERDGRQIVATREPGRLGLPRMTLKPGEQRLWDNRFLVSAAFDWPCEATVMALSANALTEVAAQRERGASADLQMPRNAALTLPAFMDGGRLLAVPQLDHGGPGVLRALTARFVPI